MIDTPERVVKELSGKLRNLITEYDFKQYDFHSIKQTLLDYVAKNYPDYSNYIKSDYIIMLIESVAYMAEMMAYRMDMSMNEAFLPTAKDRENIIKHAKSLGYEYQRAKASVAVVRINLLQNGFMTKKTASSLTDILSGTQTEILEFEKSSVTSDKFKINNIIKSFDVSVYENTISAVYAKLGNFNEVEGIKTIPYTHNGISAYKRVFLIDNIVSTIIPNSNYTFKVKSDSYLFEFQSLKLDRDVYQRDIDINSGISYSEDSLYESDVSGALEVIGIYDMVGNLLSKDMNFVITLAQGGSYSRTIENLDTKPNMSVLIPELNIFRDKFLVKQFDSFGQSLRTYTEHDNGKTLSFKTENTYHGFVRVSFGSDTSTKLQPAAFTRIYYRHNAKNDEILFDNVYLSEKTLNLNIFNEVTTTYIVTISEDIFVSGGENQESNEVIKNKAILYRSIAGSFVSIDDYANCGLLHPRVMFSTALLRTYIGRNSSRMEGKKVNIYFDNYETNIAHIPSKNKKTKEMYELLYIENALFTPNDSQTPDSIKFTSTGKEYFFEIFDINNLKQAEIIGMSSVIKDQNNIGKILNITCSKINHLDSILTVDVIKNIFGFDFDYAVSRLQQTSTTISLIIKNKATDLLASKTSFDKSFNDGISLIMESANTVLSDTGITVSSISYKSIDKIMYFDFNLIDTDITIPTEDKSLIWYHQLSDNIVINPSKSNIVEVYVVGFETNQITGIVSKKDLSSEELLSLQKSVYNRNMLGDIVEIYNVPSFEIAIALKVFKKTNSTRSNESLMYDIHKVIDSFFDIRTLKMGDHFFVSKLITELHNYIPELEHIEQVESEDGEVITPISTKGILNSSIGKTQIVEETVIVNGIAVPNRVIIFG